MEIRRLVESDAATWWQLRLESLEGEPLSFGQAVEEHRALSLETVALRFRDIPEGNFTLGAFEDGALCGMMTFVRETRLKGRHKGYVYGVYVAPAQRRKGVGRALLLALMERAKQDPTLEQILLVVAAGQSAARKLYLSCGFQVYGTEPHALRVGAQYVDEDLMILRLR